MVPSSPVKPSDLGLRPGDLIGLCCPARKFQPAALRPVLRQLASWGWNVRLGRSVGAGDRQFGGDDALRAADLNAFFADPEVRAVWCVKGGYGTARLLPLLDPEPLRADPKWVVGFSDVSALHAWIGQATGIPSLHAPMPSTFTRTTGEALDGLYDALAGSPRPGRSAGHPFDRPGTARGRLVGGNLSVLYSLRGTPWFPDCQGAILFLEDLDELLYHVDRMMLNLRLGGVLDGLAGAVVGGLTEMRDNEVPFGRTAGEIAAEHLAVVPGPVAFGWPAGHVADNRPLVLNAEADLDVGEAGGRLTSV